MRRVVGVVAAAAVAVFGVVVAAPRDVEAAGPGDGTLTVRVIRDVNGNGAYEPATESGVAGIPVTVTDPAGGTASGTTGPDGTVTANLAGVTGGRYRVEAAIPDGMPNLRPAPAGGGLSSLTEFVTVADGGGANLTMGVWDPNDYCQANPNLVTCVLAKGDNVAAMGITTFASQLGATAPGGTVNQLSTSGQQGAVFGIGTDRGRNIYLGTYVKRHTEYGPAGPVNAVYRLNQDVPNAVSVFTTLPGTLTAHAPAGSVPYIADDVIYDRVGREGLGDVDVSPDGKTLYAVNLNDSSLYTVPVQGAGNAVTAGAAKAFAIPRPASNCEGDWHPFGIGVRSTRVLVGGVCGAENTVKPNAPSGDPSKLRAHIYTFTGSAFTPAFDFALDYPRGCAFRTPTTACQPGTATAGAVLSGSWEAWNSRIPKDTPGGFSNFVSAPQPMLSNIEIDDGGNLVIGFRDRYADMQGNQTQVPRGNTLVRGIAAGDVLRACVAGAGFTLESNGSCGGATGALPGDNQGPGGGEFYNDNWTDGNFHDQTSTGGLVHLPGGDDVWTTRIDPFDARPFHQGASQQDGNGTVLGRIEVNVSDAATPNFFGKANGLADLELLCDNAPVQLGNRVWFDTNANGRQDGDEPPVAGVKVTVTPCTGGAALPVKTTDAKGEYYLGTADGLTPDTCYNTAFDYTGVDTSALPGAPPPARLRWTTKEAGDNRRIDSNVDSAGAAQVTVGPAGSVDHTIDAGLIALPTNKLGDLVWFDENRNGVQDSGEPGVPNVTVVLRAGDTELARQTTDPNGKYLFDGLDDGAYRVCFDLTTLPPPYTGYLATRANVGDDAADSDADPATGCTAPTNLGPDKRADLTLDAGIRPPDRLGDFVWIDQNRNGLQDNDEPGVDGVTVNLRDSAGTQIATTTTADGGKYLFDKLPDGSYSVCFDTAALPPAVAGYLLTKPNAGDDAADSDAELETGCTQLVKLTVDAPEDLTLDAGLRPPDRVGDFVWIDENRNGLQDDGEPGVEGVTVNLRDSAGAQVATTKTNADGKYVFDKLPDGSYQVCFDIKALPPTVADYLLTKPNAGDDAADSDADVETGCTQLVKLTADAPEDLTLDAGLRPPDRVGDFVWIDQNRNGLQDDGEPGVDGVTVNLRDSAGAQIATTTTAGGGRYLFDKLPDGSYQVCFDIKALPPAVADYVLTKPKAGDDAADSDAELETGCTQLVKLTVDAPEDLTLDAGLVAPVNRLGDLVWLDKNRNGLQDSSEPGVEGVPVILRDGSGAEVAKTTTDGDGKYLFDDLPDGTYQVCFDVKALPAAVADYTLTTLNAGDDAADSDADPATGCTEQVTLGVGKRENLTLDAGLVAPPNRLGDLVWVDTNRNGLQDSDEPGVEGVPVVVRDGNGAEIAKTTTGSDGKYLFPDLPDGTYTVCFDLTGLPTQYAGYLLTKPNAGDDAADSDPDPKTGCTEPVTLGVGKRENLTLDAGIRPPNKLGDLVWVDTNRNGAQDGGEPGVPGVTVTAKTPDGTVVGTTKTDENGKYLFDRLPDGQFLVCFDRTTLPAQYADYQLTKPNATNNAIDSDADVATWCTPPVTLSADHPEDLTVDAGIVEPRNRIGDYVWVDRNHNGLQDEGERPAPNVPVVLLDKDGKKIMEVTTGKDGRYLFDNLPDGTFRVCFTTNLPKDLRDYTLTKAKAGNDDAKDSDADPKSGCTRQVAVGPGKREILTLDAGLVPPPTAAAAGGKGDLATTGFAVGWWFPLGLLALALGTTALLATRRRIGS